MTNTIAYRFNLATDEAGEPRVLDLDVAEALGFERPRVIRELIDRNYRELQRYGGLPRHTANSGPRGGRPTYEYRLNEAQALLIATLSRTTRAADIRQALIVTFMAWREGKTVSVRQHHRRPPIVATVARGPYAGWYDAAEPGDVRDVRLRPDPMRINAAYDRRAEELASADPGLLMRLMARALARLDDIAPEPKVYTARERQMT